MSPVPSRVSDTGSVGSQPWWTGAACRETDLAVFFSPETERAHARARREDRARRICEGCPVLLACREHALAAGEPYGIWGGLTEFDRRHAARRRKMASRGRTARRLGPELSRMPDGDRRG